MLVFMHGSMNAWEHGRMDRWMDGPGWLAGWMAMFIHASIL